MDKEQFSQVVIIADYSSEGGSRFTTILLAPACYSARTHTHTHTHPQVCVHV
jgi:hypothetical protein